MVIEVPASVAPFGLSSPTFGLPIMRRQGGLLIAVPLNALDGEKLVDEMTTEGDGLLGPSKSFTTELASEEEEGSIAFLGVSCRFMVVDFSDDILLVSKEYNPEQDDISSILPFHQDYPTALPTLVDLPEKIKEWVTGQNIGRAHFYSAREEPDTPAVKTPPPKKAAAPKRVSNASVAEQLAALQAQVQALVQAQIPKQIASVPAPEIDVPFAASPGKPMGAPKMPALSAAFLGGAPGLMVPSVKKAAALVGPPPKTMAATPKPATTGHVLEEDEPATWKAGTSASGDPLLQVLAQQGSALTALVAHIAAGGDAIGDLSTTAASSQSTSTKGVQRREKLQTELATGSSNFYQLLLQQLHRRLYPSKPIPVDLDGYKGTEVSLLRYLERFGGYKLRKDTGVTLWLLGYVLDALIQDDVHRAKEHLALTIAALEQQGIDGDFTLGYLIALVEEPPIQLYQDRTLSMHAQGRPFAPLVAPSHAAVAISYLKELEVLNTKKKETQTASPTAKSTTNQETPSPRRRPRYPKKPKADAANPQ